MTKCLLFHVLQSQISLSWRKQPSKSLRSCNVGFRINHTMKIYTHGFSEETDKSGVEIAEDLKRGG